MNTEIIVHPKLHHYGLITANLNDMIDWYQKVLGMTINQHAKIPAIARLVRQGPPFSAFAFVSNDEMDHRIVFFEVPKAALDPDKRHHTGLQHVAFQCETVDELLGTYLRLKDSGIEPLWAADHGVTFSIYYQDPDRNVVEIGVNNYGSPDKPRRNTLDRHVQAYRPRLTLRSSSQATRPRPRLRICTNALWLESLLPRSRMILRRIFESGTHLEETSEGAVPCRRPEGGVESTAKSVFVPHFAVDQARIADCSTAHGFRYGKR